MSGSDTPFRTLKENIIRSQINASLLAMNEQRFDVTYTIVNYDCLNPRISISTHIKVNVLNGQMLEIYDRSLNNIGQCVSTTNYRFCPRLDKCISNYDLSTNNNSSMISVGQNYTFVIYQILNIDSMSNWCDDSEYAINTQLSFRCDGLPTPEPTRFPTHFPTIVPTDFPTSIPTLSPSETPIIEPTPFPTQATLAHTSQILSNTNTDEPQNLHGKQNAQMNKDMLETIVIASIVIFVLCIVCVGCVWYRKRNKKGSRPNKSENWRAMTELQSNNRLQNVDGTEGDENKLLTVPRDTLGYDETPLTLGDENDTETETGVMREDSDEDNDYIQYKTPKNQTNKFGKGKKDKKYAKIESPSQQSSENGNGKNQTEIFGE